MLLIGLSVWRKRLRVSYETWQLTHSILAVVIVTFALLHAIKVGYYLNTPWKLRCGSSTRVRSLRSSSGYGSSYRLPLSQALEVKRIEPERDSTWTLVIEPEGTRASRSCPGNLPGSP